jgi:hypothetical protein
MVEFVETPPSSNFSELDRSAGVALRADKYDVPDVPEDWRKFVRCLELVQSCKGLTSVAETKILHRKRPDLVPINDSLLRALDIAIWMHKKAV